MLDRVRARLHGPLHGLGRGRVHGHRQAALPRDAHRRGQLLAEEHHRGHDVVAAAHDAARGDQLDLVHAVQDLLAHRLDEGVGPVDGHHGAACRRTGRAPRWCGSRRRSRRAAARRCRPAANASRQATSAHPDTPTTRSDVTPAGSASIAFRPCSSTESGKVWTGSRPVHVVERRCVWTSQSPGRSQAPPRSSRCSARGAGALTDLADDGAVDEHPRVAARLGQERVDQMHAGDDEAHARALLAGGRRPRGRPSGRAASVRRWSMSSSGLSPHDDQVGELADLDRAELVARRRRDRRRGVVAASSVCHGVAPSFTHSPISSSAASASGRMSEPSAILTPAPSAFRNQPRCSAAASSARLTQVGREAALLHPARSHVVAGLAGRQVRDAERRHVPGVRARGRASGTRRP